MFHIRIESLFRYCDIKKELIRVVFLFVGFDNETTIMMMIIIIRIIISLFSDDKIEKKSQ